MKNVIYIIRNTVNKKFYIGSAVRFNVRKNQHLHHLKKGSHHNPPLQNFVNKYGIDKIYFEFLEINCDELIQREQYYIDNLKPVYNIHLIAQSPKGVKRTPQQIQNMKDGRMRNGGYKKGYKLSKDVIDKMKKTRLKNGGYIVTEETKLNHSIKMKGRKLTKEHKNKISEKLKGREFSKDHKDKLSKSAMGNNNWKNIDYNNPERNKKISLAMKKIQSKPVINTETGEKYDSVKEAAKAYGMPVSTFSKHLSGFNKKNKTPFIYEH